MSGILEFYSVSWGEIRASIGSRNRKLYRAILKQFEPEFESLYDPSSFGSGPDFSEGLERWIEGELGGGGGPPVEPAPGDALGLVLLIKHHGQCIGSLQHSEAAGTKFEERFVRDAAVKALQPLFPLELLLSRPLFGVEQEDLPLWGGLTREELASIAPKLSQDAPTDESDLDIDAWMSDLWNCLGSAVDLGTDLITLYV